ncbi:MAG TPA: ATP-binding cassette domain-containing protein, partial [Gaiellaceae bacterium]|nr:ATP-binding cassette domain-containing protein [Gaiellaceae bacterium]
MTAVLESERVAPEDGSLAAPGLELRQVSKRFGPVQALAGCSFAAPRGAMLGFLGPNGAGKTTAMRAIFGLVALDAGQVLWHERPIGLAERMRFGYMPEERGLYPRMALGEQLEYFGSLHGLDAAAARAAAARWLERLGLAGRAGAKVEELSHGNQQRTQLAAALLHEPELLVLDEPF